MNKKIAISRVHNDFVAVLRELNRALAIALTRYGKPVAMLVSVREYKRLRAPKADFWEAYTSFRTRVNLEELDIDPGIWEDVRDPSPGRVVK